MQKVERRRHREIRHRRWIWLAAAAVLLAGSVTAAMILSREPEQITAEEQHWGMLIDRQPEELVSVTVKRRGDQPWTLVRAEDGSLVPENDSTWAVSEQQSELLLDNITTLRYEEILSEDAAAYRETPELFGLAEPRVSVTARYTDGTEITLNIGNDTGLEEGWHYMTVEGEERLYAISSAIANDLDTEYEVLRPVPRPEIYSALLDRITVTDGKETLIEWKLRGQITDRDAGDNWEITSPFSYPADEEAIQSLKKSAENLRLGVFTAPVTEENLREYGLDSPRKILTFHMAAGNTGTVSETGVYDVVEHDENTVTLQIGNSADDMTTYVRFRDEVFTVNSFTLTAFTDADPMDSVARYPVLTTLNSLDSLTVEENGETLQYVLQEKAESGTEEEGEEPARECLLNGQEIPYVTFEAAYDRLLTVTFSGVLPKGAEWKEPYKKYTFRTLSGGTHTVELCDWDGIHDAVTVDGYTLFYLIRGGMTGLPASSGETESR